MDFTAGPPLTMDFTAGPPLTMGSRVATTADSPLTEEAPMVVVVEGTGDAVFTEFDLC
jgi:hypothetical protein